MGGPADPVSYGTRRFSTVVAGSFLVTDAWFAANDVLPPHHHARTVVGVTLSGRWDSVVGRRTLTNCAGILHTEPAGDTHSNHFGPAATHVLIIQPDPDASELLRPCGRLLTDVHRLPLAGARAAAGRLITELAYPDDVSVLALEAGCLDLLALATRAAGRWSRPSPPWLTRVVDYLHAEFRHTPTLEQIAGVAGVHPSHLVREFKRAFGETPALWIRRRRIELAAEAVSGSGEPLAQIAAAAGFSDQSHFTRQFRRHFGVSPASYRRANRGSIS